MRVERNAGEGLTGRGCVPQGSYFDPRLFLPLTPSLSIEEEMGEVYDAWENGIWTVRARERAGEAYGLKGMLGKEAEIEGVFRKAPTSIHRCFLTFLIVLALKERLKGCRMTGRDGE